MTLVRTFNSADAAEKLDTAVPIFKKRNNALVLFTILKT